MIKCARRTCPLPVEWITCVAGVTLFLCDEDHARLLSVRLAPTDVAKLEEAFDRAHKERVS